MKRYGFSDSFRRKVVTELNMGVSAHELASTYCISINTVYRWRDWSKSGRLQGIDEQTIKDVSDREKISYLIQENKRLRKIISILLNEFSL